MPAPRAPTFLFYSTHKTPRAAPSLHTCHYHSQSTRHAAAKRPHPHYAARSHPGPRPKPNTSYFSSTSSTLAREQNYYEILDLPITATGAEIKKKFYSLSLKHHPDRNRSDPNASSRFSQISSAYNILGNATKRAAYDRDHGFNRLASTSPHSHPQGSHSSHGSTVPRGGSYAGSRTASGLSKQRGAFRGPPPSFYEQGGYGRTGRTAEGAYGGRGGGGGGGGGHFSSSSFGKKGPQVDPEDPIGFVYRNPLGHFNAREHYRTQQKEDLRRGARRSRAARAAWAKVQDEELAASSQFSIIRVILLLGILGGSAVMVHAFSLPATSAPKDLTAVKQQQVVGGKGRRKGEKGNIEEL